MQHCTRGKTCLTKQDSELSGQRQVSSKSSNSAPPDDFGWLDAELRAFSFNCMAMTLNCIFRQLYLLLQALCVLQQSSAQLSRAVSVCDIKKPVHMSDLDDKEGARLQKAYAFTVHAANDQCEQNVTL